MCSRSGYLTVAGEVTNDADGGEAELMVVEEEKDVQKRNKLNPELNIPTTPLYPVVIGNCSSAPIGNLQEEWRLKCRCFWDA